MGETEFRAQAEESQPLASLGPARVGVREAEGPTGSPSGRWGCPGQGGEVQGCPAQP